MTEYNSGGVSRIFKYWLWNSQKFMATIWIIWIFYILFFTLMQGDLDSVWVNINKYFPYVIFLGVFGEISYCTTLVLHYAPRAIAFGSTRKEAFIGEQLSLLLICIENIIVCTILQIIMANKNQKAFNVTMMLFFAALLVLGISMGQLFSIVRDRLGAVGMAISIVIIIAVVIGLVVIVLLISENGGEWIFETSNGMAVFALAASIIIYGIVAAAVNKRIKKQCVVF